MTGHGQASDGARKIAEGFSQLGRALQEGREQIAEPARKFIHERPIAALGIAFGIGYVLAGGLWSRLTARLVGAGWKLGGMALARDFMKGLASEAGEGF